MRKKHWAAAITAALIFSGLFDMKQARPAAGQGLPFDDLANTYAQSEILELYNHSILDGTGFRKFEPAKTVTRAEFSAMLLRMMQMDPVRNSLSPFSDTPKDAWYYGWLHAALNLGIAQGTGPHTFSPDKPLTRQEAAVLLSNTLKQSAGPVEAHAAYPDSSAIAAWAAPSVAAVKKIGLMQGDGNGFRPLDGITRQEAAVVLSRLLNRQEFASGRQTQKPGNIQLGWLYDQPLEESKSSPAMQFLNTLSPSWFFLDQPGTLSGATVPSYVEWAHQNGKKVWPLVGNRFNADNTHRLLSDPAARQTFIKKLSDAVKNGGMDGLNIDFENMQPADRDLFTLFIGELAEALRPLQGVKLSVNVPPDLGNSWSEPYDFAALGRLADYVVFMGYEEHWSGDPQAGSVSSLPWLERSTQKLLQNIPAEKLIVGLPFYTRDWSAMDAKTVSQDLTLKEQENLLLNRPELLKWLPVEGQYLAEYSQGSGLHRIWTEDSRSLALKINSVLRAKAAGSAYWYAGSETSDVWHALDNEMKYASFQLGETPK